MSFILLCPMMPLGGHLKIKGRGDDHPKKVINLPRNYEKSYFVKGNHIGCGTSEVLRYKQKNLITLNNTSCLVPSLQETNMTGK